MVENMPTIKLNEQIDKGINVKINAIFTRHGEKTLLKNAKESILSKKGEIKSAEYGEKLNEKDAIKSYTSDTKRTIKTVDLITEFSPSTKKMNRVRIDELAFEMDRNGIFLETAKKIKKDTLGKDFKEVSKNEQQDRLEKADCELIEYYLKFGDERPDPNTYSPKETASMMARRVDIYIRMVEKLKSGSNVDLINGTHDLNIASFLKEVINFESINEIGGPIKFNEGFNIEIKTDDNKNKNVILNFRNNSYKINEEKLEELVQIAKKLEKSKYE